MGSISIYRKSNNCGKNSPMEIIITDVAGQTTKDIVADGKTTTINLQQGLYNVHVNFGIPSNILTIPINGNNIKLTAIVIPKMFKAIIHKVILKW